MTVFKMSDNSFTCSSVMLHNFSSASVCDTDSKYVKIYYKNQVRNVILFWKQRQKKVYYYDVNYRTIKIFHRTWTLLLIFKILYIPTFVQFILDQKKAINSLASLVIHFRANLVPYDVLNDFGVPVYVRASTSSPVIGCRQGPATAPGPGSHTPLSVSHPGTEPQTGITGRVHWLSGDWLIH